VNLFQAMAFYLLVMCIPFLFLGLVLHFQFHLF